MSSRRREEQGVGLMYERTHHPTTMPEPEPEPEPGAAAADTLSIRSIVIDVQCFCASAPETKPPGESQYQGCRAQLVAGLGF